MLRAADGFSGGDSKAEKTRLPGWVRAFVGAALLVAALVSCEDTTGDYPGFKALMPVGAAFLLIAAGPQNPLNRLILANPASVFLGKISYTFYLWHWPLLSFAYLILGRSAYMEGWGLRAALVAAALVLAALTWRLVETPVRYGNFLGRHKVRALVGGMCLVGVAGLFIWRAEGLLLFANEQHKAIYAQLQIPPQVEPAVLERLGFKKDELELARYTDAGATRTIAIVGDSHAQSAYAGIAKLGKEEGFNTLLLGRFPGRKKIYSDTRDQPAKILDILGRRKEIRDVFIIVRGASYDSGATRYRKGDGVKMGITGEEAGELTAFVKKLAALGKNPIVVEDNPYLDIDVRHALSPVMAGRPIKPHYRQTSKSDVLAREKVFLDTLDKLAGLPGVTVLRGTLDAFCPGENCPVFSEDGLPLYFDDDHLSFIGSDKLAREIIAPYLARNKPGPGD